MIKSTLTLKIDNKFIRVDNNLSPFFYETGLILNKDYLTSNFAELGFDASSKEFDMKDFNKGKGFYTYLFFSDINRWISCELIILDEKDNTVYTSIVSATIDIDVGGIISDNIIKKDILIPVIHRGKISEELLYKTSKDILYKNSYDIIKLHNHITYKIIKRND